MEPSSAHAVKPGFCVPVATEVVREERVGSFSVAVLVREREPD
jgi:hypothetical protein